MKILKLMTLAVLLLTVFACKRKEGCRDPKATNYDAEAKKPCDACCEYKKDDDTIPSNVVILSGNLETMTLDTSKEYLIKGQTFVKDGKILTIPAGTLIKGDKGTKGTLIIDLGGKIMAEGTAANPIIFTSNLPAGARDKGDWGGIVMLGRANCNQNAPAIEGITPAVTFGSFQSTANNAENSGILKYVRIEYAGIALSPNNETNSLTMGGVGNGTTLEYIQVSYGGDDGFEWFGGTVNAKYLVSYGTWDDDFDCDFGWSGKVQWGLAIRDPFAADQSGSNGWECDNEAGGNDVTPYTSGVFSNITVIGPRYDSTLSASNVHSGNYQHAMHLRRRTAVSIFNSVITGFPTGFRLDGQTTEDQYTAGTPNGAVENNILVSIGQRNNPAPYAAGSGNTVGSVQAYWLAGNDTPLTAHLPAETQGGKNYAKALKDAGVNPDVIMGFKYTFLDYPNNPTFSSFFTGSTQSGAAFSHSKLSGGFFTTTTYRGAFGGTDWTDDWTSFYPQGEEY